LRRNGLHQRGRRDRWGSGFRTRSRPSSSSVGHVDVRAWCADYQVELVFVPTYSSWLNWIESEFAALRYFALNGTDHRSHAEQNAAIGAYIRWRNARAEPKTGYATDSPIRTWTHYPAKAA
jgi:transposase